MADFKIAEKITGHNEGGFADNHSDHGGMTYAGIARNFWPQWGGWAAIDRIIKTYGNNPHTVDLWASKDNVLQSQISLFYKQNFWDVNKLDLFKDQQVANSVYDFGVNSGTKKAAKTLQAVLMITQDGVIGSMSLESANEAKPEYLLEAYNKARKDFYLQLASNPTQHQFLKSWLSRLKDYEA